MINGTLNKLFVGLVFSCSMAVFSHAAIATESGFYVGVGAGVAKASGGSFGNREDSTTKKLFGGYNFNSNFGVELGLIDFGSFRVIGNPIGLSTAVSAKQISVVGRIPISSDFSLFGKVGAYWWEAEDKPCFAFSYCNNSDVSGSASAGAQYMVHKNIGIRVGLDWYHDADNLDITAMAVNVLGQF